MTAGFDNLSHCSMSTLIHPDLVRTRTPIQAAGSSHTFRPSVHRSQTSPESTPQRLKDKEKDLERRARHHRPHIPHHRRHGSKVRDGNEPQTAVQLTPPPNAWGGDPHRESTRLSVEVQSWDRSRPESLKLLGRKLTEEDVDKEKLQGREREEYVHPPELPIDPWIQVGN